MKRLPPELADWYFTYNWDVKELWKLKGKSIEREVASLEWHLDAPLWSSKQGKGILFDLRPREVLENPRNHLYHWNRIEKADTSYSICMTDYKGCEVILDGIHRLAKFVHMKIEPVNVKLINENNIRKIATPS